MPRDKSHPVQRLMLRIKHPLGTERVEASGEWTVQQLQTAVFDLEQVMAATPSSIYFVTQPPDAKVFGGGPSLPPTSLMALGIQHGTLLILRLTNPGAPKTEDGSGGRGKAAAPAPATAPPAPKRHRPASGSSSSSSSKSGTANKATVWKHIGKPEELARAIMHGSAAPASKGTAAHDQFAAADRAASVSSGAVVLTAKRGVKRFLLSFGVRRREETVQQLDRDLLVAVAKVRRPSVVSNGWDHAFFPLVHFPPHG